MKIKPDHYAVIEAAILKIPANMRQQMREKAANDPRVKDLEKRVRWDYLWLTGLTPWLCHEVYTYANDTHIDTALRAIVAKHELD